MFLETLKYSFVIFTIQDSCNTHGECRSQYWHTIRLMLLVGLICYQQNMTLDLSIETKLNIEKASKLSCVNLLDSRCTKNEFLAECS